MPLVTNDALLGANLFGSKEDASMYNLPLAIRLSGEKAKLAECEGEYVAVTGIFYDKPTALGTPELEVMRIQIIRNGYIETECYAAK